MCESDGSNAKPVDTRSGLRESTDRIDMEVTPGMSAPTITAPSNVAEEIAELLTSIGLTRVRRNAHGQWCTRDVYGGWQPHGSYEKALMVLDNDEVS